MELGKFSIGIGDRFAHQGVAQLRAIMHANQSGLEISPVWNKSNREHIYVHSRPTDVRKEADAPVATHSFNRKDELCAPYADVIEIDSSALPSVDEVNAWSSEKYYNTLRHIPGHPDYNANFRQLIHVAYKVAAEMGENYTDLLKKHEEVIGQCVEENIYDRHLKRLFNL